MLLATALALLITGCAQQTFTVQNKPQQQHQRKPSPIISSFLELGRRKTVDAAKICGGAENVVKTETQQTFVNGLLGFITLGIYTPLEARVYCHTLHEPPHWWATLSALLINILLAPSSCFCIVISLWGWNNPVQRVCQSGRLHYPRRRRWCFTHWLTDCFDVQPTTTSGNIITQSIIFSFSIS